jgi:hypothetical protein
MKSEGRDMRAVKLLGEDYLVCIPEARVRLVLTKDEFIRGAERYNDWERRRTQAQREAQAAPAADEARRRRAVE